MGIISRVGSSGEKEWLFVSSAKNFGEYSGFYYPPGGHIEGDESKAEALKREIKEELDLRAEPIKEIAVSSGDIANQETYWWLCEVSGSINLDAELNDFQYMTKDIFRKEPKIWPATKKFFEEYIF